MDQDQLQKVLCVYNVVAAVAEVCVWRPSHPTGHKFIIHKCRVNILDRKVIFSWSIIQQSNWFGLVKLGPGLTFFVSVSPTQGPFSASQEMCVSLCVCTYVRQEGVCQNQRKTDGTSRHAIVCRKPSGVEISLPTWISFCFSSGSFCHVCRVI